MKSIRLCIGGGAQDGNLNIELIPDRFCNLKIETQPRADDAVFLNISFRIERNAHGIEGESDKATDNSAMRSIDVADGNVVGISNGLAHNQSFREINQSFQQGMKDELNSSSVCRVKEAAL